MCNSRWNYYYKFGMGSPKVTVMDPLSAISPKQFCFGCNGVKKTENKIWRPHPLPIAAIRGGWTSTDYFPPEVPLCSAFALQKPLSLYHHRDYGSWLLDRHCFCTHQPPCQGTHEVFKAHLQSKSVCHWYETFYYFMVIFLIGSLQEFLLVSDSQWYSEGKTSCWCCCNEILCWKHLPLE